MALPPSVNFGNPDATAIYMRKTLGITLKGDAELHMAGGDALRVHDAVPAATLASAISASALSADDMTSLTTRLGKKKLSK